MSTRREKEELLALLEEKNQRFVHNKIRTYYPDKGPLRRELYAKHISFFEAGPRFRQRLMLAANRVGKTEGVGLYELTLHLTGDYPWWWKGRRFDRPVKTWACGDTGKTLRETLQNKLLGDTGNWGTGLIPKTALARVTRGSGVADSIDTIYVKHKTGGLSMCVLKSYDQRRIAFQGSEQDVILLDEEPPMDIYVECLIRTMTNDGMVMLTFTPLQGLSEVVLTFLPGGKLDDKPVQYEDKFIVMATWDDVPHLSDKVKQELWRNIPPFQRDARSKGIPQLGSGAIYPVPDSDILVPDFAIPEHWKHVYGLDLGWNKTAAVWRAINPDTNVSYLYSSHYQGQAEASVHAMAIRSRGEWIPGAIDPASKGRNQSDGVQLLEQYRGLGLDLTIAKNAVEAGIQLVWQALSGGTLKVFSSLTDWQTEKRLYRRDEKGVIVKENDHLLDAMRYVMMSGDDIAKRNPRNASSEETIRMYYSGGGTSWMG